MAVYPNILSEIGLEVIKKISCSTQLSVKFFLLVNVKITFLSRKYGILGLFKPEKC